MYNNPVKRRLVSSAGLCPSVAVVKLQVLFLERFIPIGNGPADLMRASLTRSQSFALREPGPTRLLHVGGSMR